MKRRGKAALCLGMAGVMAAGTMLSGCGKEQTNGKVKIEVQTGSRRCILRAGKEIK